MHNTSEIIDCGTHLRTAPFARAIYDTDATEVVINSWNDVYTNQPSAAEIGVYVNSVYQESVRPTAMGAAQHTVSLPAGDKRVEIVTNGYRGPAVVNIPSLIGPSIWLKSLSFNRPAVRVPPTTERGVVIIGDSIANGSKLPSAIQQAYPRLLQMENPDFPINVIGRGGLALHDITTGLGTETNFRPKKLVREVVKYNPLLVIIALGYNDAARNVWTSTSYRDAIDAIARDITHWLPDARVAAMGVLYARNKPGNYTAIKDAALGAMEAFGLAPPPLTDSDLDADGVHPNEAGHQKIAATLAPIVATRTVPDLRPFSLNLAPFSSGTVVFNTKTDGDTVISVPNSSTVIGPKWHRYVPDATTTPYSFRLTIEASNGQISTTDLYAGTYQDFAQPAGTWINNGVYFYFSGPASGRVRVDVALTGTTDVLASYYIWRGAGMAPA